MSSTNISQARQQWHGLLAATAELVEELSAEQLQELRRHWQRQYGGAHSSFLWHRFSFGQHPHLTGAPAVAAYEAQPVKAYLVFFEHPALGFRCRGHQLPGWPQLRALAAQGPVPGRDVYVTHPNLHWVFCLTHEADFGPYFARFTPGLPTQPA